MSNQIKEAEQAEAQIKVSVRNLVEFVLRQGDIDNRHQGAPENAMLEGGRIHRMIQKRMGAEYQAEVTLRISYPGEKYTLVVEGRADGIIDTGYPSEEAEARRLQLMGCEPGQIVIDEIKGTYRELSRMKGPVFVHVAQAKCYAYMYGRKREADEVRVRMTYCNLETEEIRYFFEDYRMTELQEWFEGLIEEYRKWTDYEWEWKQISKASIEQLQFPFSYREGQRELVSHVYHTIYHKKKLFLEAPTGVGKTIATVFPALKAVGKGLGDKIFYLTAKTITRTVAENTFAQLREQGLHFKTVVLTAKEKICFMEETQCNPDYCPYAKGHYDRINSAVYDLLTNADSFTREKVEYYARKHTVCPFEMCLDMSLFANGIICDYNYLFDPHVYLKRFFAEGAEGNYIFLIDEAHNLLERGREMYSASLLKDEISGWKKELKKLTLPESPNIHSVLVRQGYAEKMVYQLERCNKALLELKRECESCQVVQEIDDVMKELLRLHSVMDNYLDEQETEQIDIREGLVEFYFSICHFLDIYERVDENYVKYTQTGEDGSFVLKLFCVNPAVNLRECMRRGRSSILFSATFLPIQYYKRLLGGEAQDYEVYAKSVFNPEKRALLIANDVTSKYTRRSRQEFYNIACYINEIVSNRYGNYMVFCPSYNFLYEIYDVYMECFAGEEQECIIQQDFMNEQDREAFLARFEGNESCDLQADIGMEIQMDSEDEHILIGFCVLGGIFSEGIDLKNDSLIGVIIVGTGLPQVCNERELLKEYFDEEGGSGFDYSYRIPGMNKVLQAAGRVIRTAEDVGVIALLDERFLQNAYQRMFPREWENYEVVTLQSVSKRVERFWDSWL